MEWGLAHQSHRFQQFKKGVIYKKIFNHCIISIFYRYWFRGGYFLLFLCSI